MTLKDQYQKEKHGGSKDGEIGKKLNDIARES